MVRFPPVTNIKVTKHVKGVESYEHMFNLCRCTFRVQIIMCNKHGEKISS